MPHKYYKAESISATDAGFDENWLQEHILADPSILGLGDLSVIRREKRQGTGGRIDFLMYDVDKNIMYEVEVMLGRLDESHIIRTIEYWDIERRRWLDREHHAVIVAEEITSRFFNVIGLFNRVIPIIAIQLNALKVEDKIVLNFTKVLDVYEPPEDEEAESEPVDRKWWENRSNPQSLKIVDQCANLLSVGNKEPRVTYNRSHIALGGSKQNFCWFHPRKVQTHCHLELKTGTTNQQSIINQLEQAGISATPYRDNAIKAVITPDEMRQHEAIIREVLNNALKSIGGGLT
ncbi:MAG: hypothetical protein HY259_14230 [Chloroflexi bacterium]|nr:hypothetical protein [Chloroflexota bacterium]